MISCTRTSNQY